MASSTAKTVEEYLAALDDDRKVAMEKLRAQVLRYIDNDFEETMQYGMISYVVPHRIFPAGYHCNPKDALPYLSLASQKNYISVYSMSYYGDERLQEWFMTEYAKISTKKPNIGKSCIRFKKPDDIPYELIGQLAGKLTASMWIDQYRQHLKS